MGHLAAMGDSSPATLRRAMLYGTVAASYCVQGFSIEDLGQRRAEDLEERVSDLLSIVTV